MAKGDFGGKRNSNGFDRNPANINKVGRPEGMKKLLVKYFFDEHNLKLSPVQIKEILFGILGKTKRELQELSRNKDAPFWLSLIAKKCMVDHKNGSIELLDKILDRTIGKAPQTLHTVTENYDMTIPDKLKRLEELKKIRIEIEGRTIEDE